MSLTVIVGWKVEAAHRGTSTVAEACAVLWRSQDVVVRVTECGWRRWKAGERVEEGRDIAVVLTCPVPGVDRPYAYNDDGHHSALTLLFALLTVGPSCTATAC